MGINSLAIYNDQLISAGSGSIRIWNCEDYSHIATLADAGSQSLAVHDNILYVTSYHETYMWDLSTYQRIDVAKLEHAEMVLDLAVYDGKLFSAQEGSVIKVFKCEGLHLSAIHGDPEACTLSVKDLRARVLEKKRRRVKWTLPNGKSGGYNDRDIEKLSGKGPNSPLVRLYNTYVRATRDLSDAERAAPFCHNTTFPSGEED